MASKAPAQRADKLSMVSLHICVLRYRPLKLHQQSSVLEVRMRIVYRPPPWTDAADIKHKIVLIDNLFGRVVGWRLVLK
jgi:hypothetical protein